MRQQPARVLTTDEPATIKEAPNRCFIKAYRYPTEAAEGEDHGDASHSAVATYRPCKVTSNKRI
jgi:hypothetical protein